MKALLRKEFTLSLFPLPYCFWLLAGLLLIPNYPYFVTFFYAALGVMLSLIHISTKVAYGVRRRHLLGGHLDALMNYPFRNALIAYLLGGDAAEFQLEMETLRQNYPDFAFYNAMNSLGTHDTLRILTYLGTGTQRQEWTKEQRGGYVMSGEERRRGAALLKSVSYTHLDVYKRQILSGAKDLKTRTFDRQ